MASFDKTVQFFSLITTSRRITINHLAEQMECSRGHIYRLVGLASRHISIRLEDGVVVNEGLCNKIKSEKDGQVQKNHRSVTGSVTIL